MSAVVQGSARGHQAVRATHSKTLELVREPAIGEAATCVVAVGAALDEDALAGLCGRVELTLSVGDVRDTVRGRLNPAFQPGDPLVVRRSPAVTRDALIVDADRGASALDRALVAELAREEAEVLVALRAVEGAAPGVLVVDPGAAWGGTDRPVSDVSEALDRGARVVAQWNPATVAAAHDAGHTVLPVPGLAPVVAALVVAGVALERLRVEAGAPARLAPGAARIATDVRGDQVERLLRGAERGLIALDIGTPREEFLPWRAGEAVQIPGGARRRAIVVAGASPAPAGAQGLDHATAALARALIDHGATPRDVTRAVQEATGLPRSVAYDAVLELGT